MAAPGQPSGTGSVHHSGYGSRCWHCLYSAHSPQVWGWLPQLMDTWVAVPRQVDQPEAISHSLSPPTKIYLVGMLFIWSTFKNIARWLGSLLEYKLQHTVKEVIKKTKFFKPLCHDWSCLQKCAYRTVYYEYTYS